MGTQSRNSDEVESITLSESDGLIVARDESTGIASQGQTKSEALVNLAEALELHSRPDPNGSEITEANAPWFEE